MRLAQQLIGSVPMIPNSGNHELEPNLHGNYFTVGPADTSSLHT